MSPKTGGAVDRIDSFLKLHIVLAVDLEYASVPSSIRNSPSPLFFIPDGNKTGLLLAPRYRSPFLRGSTVPGILWISPVVVVSPMKMEISHSAGTIRMKIHRLRLIFHSPLFSIWREPGGRRITDTVIPIPKLRISLRSAWNAYLLLERNLLAPRRTTTRSCSSRVSSPEPPSIEGKSYPRFAYHSPKKLFTVESTNCRAVFEAVLR